MSLPPLPFPIPNFPSLPQFPFSAELRYVGDDLKLIGQGPIASLVEILSDKNGLGNLQKVGQFLINETGQFDVPFQLGGHEAREIRIISGPITKRFIVNPRMNSVHEKIDRVSVLQPQPPNLDTPEAIAHAQIIAAQKANQRESNVETLVRTSEDIKEFQAAKLGQTYKRKDGFESVVV